ncbi:hypothetical protein Sango_2804000 [Sesamum angolense]|uniref:C2 domain-containing protein n=1 Tax=Sesamum angolense TaxID=2727404 RepID=A0AAE1W0T2_9LAMI|nr:hypothetical protein Sango_2804000 [Sesamum angolense]
MGKVWVEVCLISARGLRRTSSLWKLQWFAVGWIQPEDKYCTRVDTSGNANPVWKTKFSVAVDTSDLKFQDLALHVEVYSREPIFLRESLLDQNYCFERVSGQAPFASTHFSATRRHQYDANSSKLFPPPPVGGANYAATGGPSYQPPRTSPPPPPPPPPPPANVGYFPNFFPTNNYTPSSYINMPSSVAPPGHGRGHGFGMGAGAGALAAGAVIFGDDFLTGFDLPGASGDPSITISTNPPF